LLPIHIGTARNKTSRIASFLHKTVPPSNQNHKPIPPLFPYTTLFRSFTQRRGGAENAVLCTEQYPMNLTRLLTQQVWVHEWIPVLKANHLCSRSISGLREIKRHA